ncbi:18 kDa seed maturation protein, partial [Tanacetum coccineum]
YYEYLLEKPVSWRGVYDNAAMAGFPVGPCAVVLLLYIFQGCQKGSGIEVSIAAVVMVMVTFVDDMLDVKRELGQRAVLINCISVRVGPYQIRKQIAKIVAASIKGTTADIGASAKSIMEKTKATLQEKVHYYNHSKIKVIGLKLRIVAGTIKEDAFAGYGVSAPGLQKRTRLHNTQYGVSCLLHTPYPAGQTIKDPEINVIDNNYY